jgi:nitrogen PTS system EIIA component
VSFAPTGVLSYTHTIAMKVLDILDPAAIVPEMRANSKPEALQELAAVLAKIHPNLDQERLVEVLLEREELGSTAIGEGIAIPHGKLPGIGGVVAAFGRSTRGIDFDSLDGSPTRLFFLLVAPEDSAGVHLKALARISRLLKDRAFRERLFAGTTREALFATIREEDEKY